MSDHLPRAQAIFEKARRDLQNGHVPLEELVVTQNLSRMVESYRVPSPAVRAARQLQENGRLVAPGQFIRFVFVRGQERVRAWDLGVDARIVDVKRYRILVERVVQTIMECFMSNNIYGLHQ